VFALLAKEAYNEVYEEEGIHANTWRAAFDAEGDRKIVAIAAKGAAISEISEITGLSADEVKNLP